MNLPIANKNTIKLVLHLSLIAHILESNETISSLLSIPPLRSEQVLNSPPPKEDSPHVFLFMIILNVEEVEHHDIPHWKNVCYG